MNSSLKSLRYIGHTQTGLRFKVSSDRPVKQQIEPATHGSTVQRGRNTTGRLISAAILSVCLPHDIADDQHITHRAHSVELLKSVVNL